MEYKDFINKKSHLKTGSGFKSVFIPSYLYDFQKYLTNWSINSGRSAVFADCGMGKTPIQLVWAENVVRKSNKSG